MTSLSVLFHQAVSTASTASNLPTVDEQTQVFALLTRSQSLLHEVVSRVSILALFSPNELLEDIPTRNLIYLLPSFVLAEVVSKLTTHGKDERIARILDFQRYYRTFVNSLELYEIVSEADKSLYSNRTSVADPAKRREHKIAQYKQEKAVRSKIDSIRSRRTAKTTNSSGVTDLDLITILLQSSNSDDDDADDDDDDMDEATREITLLLLRLFYAQAHAQLDSSEQELDLLRNAPPSPPQQSQRESRTDEANTWRLDAPEQQGGSDGRGPLLDASGKPLRPFTILPAGSGTHRARLQAQVFGPDHRLPSMSVDEYLEIERQRGNIITGGGPQSEERLTTSEQLTLDAEMDGTAFAGERGEEKRQKDESWARYTDTHPKGAGNTMNRG